MKVTLILLAMSITLGACNSTNESAKASADTTPRTTATQDPNLLIGNWRLYLDTPRTENVPELSFALPEKRVTGTTGCNRLVGTFNIDGNNISFGQNIATTKMACINYDENKFVNALLSVTSFQVRSDELFLMNKDKVALRMVRK